MGKWLHPLGATGNTDAFGHVDAGSAALAESLGLSVAATLAVGCPDEDLTRA